MCIERQAGSPSDFELAIGDGCFICKGMMERVEALAKNVALKARGYQFSTFSIGLSMSGIQEREDEVRSVLKLKGERTVKNELSKIIAAGVGEDLGKRSEKQNPDLTAVLDLDGLGVTIHSKPIFFYGRYTKPHGLPQRREWCHSCRGRGCEKCEMSGFERSPNVEEKVGRKLMKATGADGAKFTWMGSEDKESRVEGTGRPFVVELKNPRKRRAPTRFVAAGRGGLVRISRGRLLPSKPTKLPGFRFRTRIAADASKKVGADAVRQLAKAFRNAVVVFDRPNDRPVSKKVYAVRAKAHGRTLLIDAELDGGLPVKRFVSGELVSPSVSEVLKTEVRCRKFDIRGVEETGEFGFGEISRLQT